MNFTIRIMISLCQIFVLLCALNVHATTRQDLSPQLLKNLTQSEVKNIKMGVKVYSLKTNETLFEYHADDLLKPASNLKLVTTLAALKYLGADYTFKTKLYIDGEIKNGILNGNLYIKGFGDPKLVSEELWVLTNDLKRVGFSHVTGKLVLDESFFDSIRTVRDGAQRYETGADRAYDAPLGALSVNFNTTAIYVQPGERLGKKAKVIVDPNNTYVRVINKSKTVQAHSQMTLKVSRAVGKTYDTIIVSGGMPLDHLEKRFYRNITHPLYYSAALFRRFFKEQGITIGGKDGFSTVPVTAREILVHESRPLRIIVSDLNKISNNFIAEQMLKTLAAELKNPPGSTDKGLDVLGDFLKELGVHSRYRLVNGSGLSDENVMTASNLVDVLNYGYRNFEVSSEYMASMGIVGIDGTVAKRLQESIAKGKVRVKTGSLSGVSSLSGYLNTISNEQLSFSILMNDPEDRANVMQELQDKILLILCGLE